MAGEKEGMGGWGGDTERATTAGLDILFPAAAARTARCNAHGFALLIPSGLS